MHLKQAGLPAQEKKTKREEKSDRKITTVYLLLLNKSTPFDLNHTINKLIIFSHLIL